jgi:hypothetical protein
MPVTEASSEETPYGRYMASVAKETFDPDEAYADWPGDFTPARVPWPVE